MMIYRLSKMSFIISLIMLAAAPVTADVVLDAGDALVRSNGLTSGPLGSLSDEGWSSGLMDSAVESHYLYFVLLPGTINPSEGTITITINRREQQSHEALFVFTDENFEPVWGPEVEWSEPVPGIVYAGLSISKSRISIPHIGKGEALRLDLLWKGPLFEMRVNGEVIEVHVNTSDPMGHILSRSRYLVVGAETTARMPAGATVPLNSPLTQFRLYDTYEPLPNRISSITHNGFEVAGYSGKLVAGDKLSVTMKAGAGGAAAFKIEDIAQRIPMKEQLNDPGTYTGTYTVQPGDYVENGQLVGIYELVSGIALPPVVAAKPVEIDARVHLNVTSSNDLVPADKTSRAGFTIAAQDANGKAVKDHPLKLTMSTTDEYTNIVGGGTFEDLVGGAMDVDWGGVTDSFGEVTAQYVSGFAAKTVLVSARDMSTGDVGVGWVRSYIDGTVDIVVTEPRATALAVSGSMELSLSRDWLTADGQSRSRITAVVRDPSGRTVSGHSMRFTLLGDNGTIRAIQGKTDSRGRALADYIAGTLMGQVQVEVRDLTSGLVSVVSIELRPDAPAEILLAADPAEVPTGGRTAITAKVTDANGNPNGNVDVLYDVSVGKGSVGAPRVGTDEKGNATVTFTAGDSAGLVTVRGTVISREPTADEISAAKGAVFLYGLSEDPGRLEVVQWLVEPGEEVVEGQELVVLEDRTGKVYTVTAPRDGKVATFIAEERDRVGYGDTLGYVIEIPE